LNIRKRSSKRSRLQQSGKRRVKQNVAVSI
jgi:hypothetical protein